MKISAISTPQPRPVARAADQPAPEQPKDEFQPAQPKGNWKIAMRRGLKCAAFLAVPAALGAAGRSIGFGNGPHSDLAGALVGGAGGQAYGACHGAIAGWELTPGKEQGGIMLAMLMVPGGAVIGGLSGTLTSVVGAAAICAVPVNVTRATLKLAGTMSTNSFAAV